MNVTPGAWSAGGFEVVIGRGRFDWQIKAVPPIVHRLPSNYYHN
jgi:hypothetical protein